LDNSSVSTDDGQDGARINNDVVLIRFSQRLTVESFIHVLSDVKVLFFSTWSFLGCLPD
jgi:hypothetical protein